MQSKHRSTIKLWLLGAYVVLVSTLSMNEIIRWLESKKYDEILIAIVYSFILFMTTVIIRYIKKGLKK
ncbi:hypothetical protein ERUR111494_03790 [Erysipelothrix urinaevulpis]